MPVRCDASSFHIHANNSPCCSLPPCDSVSLFHALRLLRPPCFWPPGFSLTFCHYLELYACYCFCAVTNVEQYVVRLDCGVQHPGQGGSSLVLGAAGPGAGACTCPREIALVGSIRVYYMFMLVSAVSQKIGSCDTRACCALNQTKLAKHACGAFKSSKVSSVRVIG